MWFFYRRYLVDNAFNGPSDWPFMDNPWHIHERACVCSIREAKKGPRRLWRRRRHPWTAAFVCSSSNTEKQAAFIFMPEKSHLWAQLLKFNWSLFANYIKKDENSIYYSYGPTMRSKKAWALVYIYISHHMCVESLPCKPHCWALIAQRRRRGRRRPCVVKAQKRKKAAADQ